MHGHLCPQVYGGANSSNSGDDCMLSEKDDLAGS